MDPERGITSKLYCPYRKRYFRWIRLGKDMKKEGTEEVFFFTLLLRKILSGPSTASDSISLVYSAFSSTAGSSAAGAEAVVSVAFFLPPRRVDLVFVSLLLPALRL